MKEEKTLLLFHILIKQNLNVITTLEGTTMLIQITHCPN